MVKGTDCKPVMCRFDSDYALHMAKLSRDDGSWKAHGLAKRYEDWENDPKHPAPKPKNKKKNTKRWCRGKEGQEHDWKSFEKNQRIIIQRCDRCRKEDWKGAIWTI